LWYDHNGVPRYCLFHPEHCGIYAKYVAFLYIGCQVCDKRFYVACEHSLLEKNLPTFPSHGTVQDFDYGDPPQHGCSGDASNSISRRIEQFWVRDGAQWERLKQFEFIVVEE
jgi:hypothetical protein